MMKSVLARAGEKAQAAAGVFAVYGGMIEAAKKEVVGFGVGVQLNKQHVLRIFSRTSLAPEGTWAAALAQAGASKENLLAGLPAGPFVVAGGAALSDAAWKAMMKSSTGMMKAMPEVYGLKEEQVNKLSKSAADMMKGVRSMSGVLELGKDGEPLFSQAIGMMRVDDAQAFLANYEKQGNLYSGLAKGAKSPLIQPAQFEKSEIGGTPALQVSKKTPPPPEGMAASPQARALRTSFRTGRKSGHLARTGRRTHGGNGLCEHGSLAADAHHPEGRQGGPGRRRGRGEKRGPASGQRRSQGLPEPPWRDSFCPAHRSDASPRGRSRGALEAQYAAGFPPNASPRLRGDHGAQRSANALGHSRRCAARIGPYVGQVMAARASSRSSGTP